MNSGRLTTQGFPFCNVIMYLKFLRNQLVMRFQWLLKCKLISYFVNFFWILLTVDDFVCQVVWLSYDTSLSWAASAERGKLRKDNIAIFKEATSAGFHASLLPWSNWNSETFFLGGKPTSPTKNKTQPYMELSLNRTRTTLVEGERSRRRAIPALHYML